MNSPWVARSSFDMMQARAEWAERKLRAMESSRVEEQATLQAQVQAQALKIQDLEQERRLLLDRLLLVVGQAPLYAKPQISPVAPTGDDGPAVAPSSRVTFDDIHQAARTAMKNGTFTTKGRSN